MKIKVTYTKFNTLVNRQVARVYRVTPFGLPAGITTAAFTARGQLLAGSGNGTYVTQSPGANGTYVKYDSTQPGGITADVPSLEIADSTNHLINGGFWFAQRQVPGTLTAIANHAYGPDRWMSERENADLQYVRVDGAGESGLTSPYFGQWKKITNAGKFLLAQPVEYLDTLKFRGKTISFQVSMKASAAKTIKIVVAELAAAGTADTLPATIVSAWGADTVDPTLGANLANISTPTSCAVTTSWQTFQFSADFPADSKNLILLVWSDSGFAADDTLSLAEVGLYFGTTQRSWIPLAVTQEKARCLPYCRRPIEVDPLNSIVAPMAYRSGTLYIFAPLSWSPMRATPVININNISAWNAAGNPTTTEIGALNNTAGGAITITGALTATIDQLSPTQGRLLLTAATSFSGTAGQICDIRFGPDVILTLSAEL